MNEKKEQQDYRLDIYTDPMNEHIVVSVNDSKTDKEVVVLELKYAEAVLLYTMLNDCAAELIANKFTETRVKH